MAKKRLVKRVRRVPPARRVDVTRLEYLNLLELARRNAEAILRLEQATTIQLRRTGELQAEFDELKKQALFRK
jgi:hypothetical protein